MSPETTTHARAGRGAWLALLPATGIPDLLGSVHASDVADVLLLAALLYAVISWLRRTSAGSAARRAWALGFAYGVLYLLADRFGLYLMTRLLRGALLVLVVALVVVFQTDFRRMLDRILTWKFSRPGPRPPVDSPVDLLVASVEKLAATRTGALIAIRGHDPWGSYVSDGVALDGRISRPLLQSIFDTSSDGHDGAVLVEGDRITRFAVHLPLARATPEVSRFGGTRHTAALGLAEVRDALVIVVSEERGTVSVALNGSLTELESPAALTPRLEDFWTAHYGSAAGRAPGRMRRTAESAAAALGIASLAWLLFSYSGSTLSRSVNVPVEIRNLPAGWAMDSDTVPTAVLTVEGSKRAMGELNPGALVISLDLAAPRAGINRVPVTEESVYLPPGIRLVAADPRYVDVVAHRLVRSTLPVRIRTPEPLPDALRLYAEPASLTVFFPPGPSRPTELYTLPVDPTQIAAGEAVRAEVVLPAGTRLFPDEPAEVSVRMSPRGSAQR